MPPIETIMRTAPVIPVRVIEDLAYVEPLARALVAGGLRLLEVTLHPTRAQLPIRPRVEPGNGRELFAPMRRHCDTAEQGGSAMLSAAGL